MSGILLSLPGILLPLPPYATTPSLNCAGTDFCGTGYTLPIWQEQPADRSVGWGCSSGNRCLKPCNHCTMANVGSCDPTPAGSEHKFSLAQSRSRQACRLPRALPFQLRREAGRDQPRHGEAVLHGGRHVQAALPLPRATLALPSGQHRLKLHRERLCFLCHLKTYCCKQDNFKK